MFVLLAVLAVAALAAPIRSDIDLECTICEVLVGYIEDYIFSGETIEDIEEFADQICLILPDSLQGICDGLLNHYIEEIIENIEAGYPPDEVCYLISFCPEPTRAELGSTSCMICEIVAELAEDWIIDEEEEIEDFVDNCCNLLPDSLFDWCTEFVDDGIEDIISGLITGNTPDEICASLGFCE